MVALKCATWRDSYRRSSWALLIACATAAGCGKSAPSNDDQATARGARSEPPVLALSADPQIGRVGQSIRVAEQLTIKDNATVPRISGVFRTLALVEGFQPDDYALEPFEDGSMPEGKLWIQFTEPLLINPDDYLYEDFTIVGTSGSMASRSSANTLDLNDSWTEWRFKLPGVYLIQSTWYIHRDQDDQSESPTATSEPIEITIVDPAQEANEKSEGIRSKL